MDRGTVTEPQTEAGRALNDEEAPICDEWSLDQWRDTILAIERQAADAALAGLAETVGSLPKWDKRTVPGGFHVNRAAVLGEIAKARKETK